MAFFRQLVRKLPAPCVRSGNVGLPLVTFVDESFTNGEPSDTALARARFVTDHFRTWSRLSVCDRLRVQIDSARHAPVSPGWATSRSNYSLRRFPLWATHLTGKFEANESSSLRIWNLARPCDLTRINILVQLEKTKRDGWLCIHPVSDKQLARVLVYFPHVITDNDAIAIAGRCSQ